MAHRANVQYCLHGDDSAYRGMIEANGISDLGNLQQYKDKSMPFFVEDWR